VRWGLIRAAAAMGALALSFAMLASPSRAGGCTPCIPPFREWLGDAPVAVYRLDRAHSRWSQRKDWLGDEGVVSCGLSGTLVFHRIDTIRGRAPATLTVRMKTIDDSCPWWGYTDGVPTGRWIVVDPGVSWSWWHVRSNGVVDSYPEGEGGPDGVPTTLAGWYRDVRAPDTATDDPVAPSATPMPTLSPFLVVAAAGGLFAGLLRPRRRGRQTTARARQARSIGPGEQLA
jgi:hypothetical protein